MLHKKLNEKKELNISTFIIQCKRIRSRFQKGVKKDPKKNQKKKREER
jgi:hypothetical protein